MTFTSINPATAVISGGTISKSAFGDPVCSNFDDHETRILANTAYTTGNADAYTNVRDTHGRWYSTSTATVTAEVGLSSWTATGNTPSGISVSTDTFTVSAAGRYSLETKALCTALGTSQKGWVGLSIRPTAGSASWYAYQMCYYDNATYTNNTANSALLLGCSAIDVTFAAGATFKVCLTCTNSTGVQLAGTATNLGTTFGIQRIG